MSLAPGVTILKDPDSVEPQGVDWTAYLAELGAGIIISQSTYAVSPVGGITLTNPGIVTGNLKTVVTLNGGVVGQTYTITNRITTSNSVIDDRSFDVVVQQR